MITRYDPFREALSLRRAMDQLFEQSFVRPNMMSGAAPQLAPMDICETQNGYEVDVALPGVRPEDIELTVDQNTLTIRGRFSHQNEHQDQPEGQAQAQQQAQAGQTPGQQQAQAFGKMTCAYERRSRLESLECTDMLQPFRKSRRSRPRWRQR